MFAMLALLFQNNANGNSITIHLDVQSSAREISYGLMKIKELQKSNGIQFSDKNPDFTIFVKIDSVSFKNEGYKIVIKNKKIEVTGGDAVGLMYVLLEIKNQLNRISCLFKIKKNHLIFSLAL